jgi:hypothetical protein
MLITNTPNNELHIFNNEGEEIVSINDSGVTKSGSGLILPVYCVASDNAIHATYGLYDTEEEASEALRNLVQETRCFGIKFDENTVVYGSAEWVAQFVEDETTLYLSAMMFGAKSGTNAYGLAFPTFNVLGGLQVASPLGDRDKWAVEFTGDFTVNTPPEPTN